MQPNTQPNQPEPKKILHQALHSPETAAKARALADTLGGDPEAAFVRAVLLYAGLTVPGGSTLTETLQELTRQRWMPIPQGLVPEPMCGDVYVITDDRRLAVRVGFVAECDRSDRSQFQAEEPGGRSRRSVTEGESGPVDYYLRLPGGCPCASR